MGKVNYLVVNGMAKIDGDNVTYTPVEIPLPSFPSDANQEQGKNYAYCTVKTDVPLSDGELRFSYRMGAKDSVFQIALWSGVSNLILGFNEGLSLFNLKAWGGATYNNIWSVGDKFSFDYDEEYNARLVMKGGVLRLFVNDIEVLYYWHQVQSVKVDMMFGGSGEIKVSNISAESYRQKCFVVMQFGKEYDDLYEEVIKPICAEFNLKVVRADESFDNNFIIHEIVSEISEATVIIADITPDNPNVYYEVGYAHALKKSVILMCNEERNKLPFDLSGFRTIFYKNSIAGNSLVKDRLSNHLKSILAPNE